MIDNRDVFIKSDTLILKALSETDVLNSGWYGWFNDNETTEYMQQGYFPNTLQKQLEFYRNQIAQSGSKLQLGILPIGSDNIIGVVSLSGIDFINRKAEFGIIIGDKDNRGKGYGTEAARLILKHGFVKLGLNKIWLGVLAEHKSAIRSYEKVGFKNDGLLREDVLVNGKYYDTLVMSILAKEFFEINK